MMSPFARGVEIFTRDADAWGLTRGRALAIALAPLVGTLAVIASVPHPGLFRRVIDEDGPVEWLQFALILVAGLLFAYMGARLIHRRWHRFGSLYLLLAAAALFVAGEEISWGQRVLGLRTPEELARINAQQEISVHNIYGLHQPFIYAVMLAGMYGTILPLVGLTFPESRRRSTVMRLLVPPLCLIPAFFVPFCYRLYRLVLQPELNYPVGYQTFVITELSEVGELCLYFAVLVFAWLNWNLLRKRPT